MKYTTFCRGINLDSSASLKKYNEINLLIKYTKAFSGQQRNACPVHGMHGA
jgi:hypothetical protein